jgi:CBS domain containing-hemolysin-like protein
MRDLFKSVKGAVVRAGAAVAVGVGAVVAPVVAHAQTSTTGSVDYTSLTSQVDFSTTVTAVLAVAGSLVLLYVAIKGAKTVLRMIRSA